MIGVLKYNYPDTMIDILVNNRVTDLIDDYPNINKVQSIEKDSIKSILRICKEGKYDLVIIVHPSFKIAFAVFLSGIKNRLGTGYRWYSYLFNIKHYQHRKFSVKHELEYNLELLSELNCNIPEKPELILNVAEETKNELLSKIEKTGFDLNSEFIIIHPGSLGSAKGWPQSYFSELIGLIQNSDLKLNIVLTGIKQEENLLKSVILNIENKRNICTFTDLSLKELSALIQRAKLFISNSTGPIHIAAAVGTFVIGFYPQKQVESATRWGPYTEKKKIFSSNLEKTPFLSDIKPMEVFNYIRDVTQSP